MKLSAYRDALVELVDQSIADFDLHTMLTPTDSASPYFGKDMVAFAEQVNGVIDTPHLLQAASMSGPPIPEYVDLSSLAGTNTYAGAPDAPALPPSQTAPTATQPTRKDDAPASTSVDDMARMLRHVLRSLEGLKPRGGQ